MTLREVIMKVLGENSLTYREITDVINGSRLYVPRDEMLVPQAQVRAAIRESAKYLEIDRTTSPHRVRLRL